MNKPKDIKVYKNYKHYFILLRGSCVGESWAVSPQKAIVNWWWKNDKLGNQFTYRTHNPQDFDAVEVM